MSEAFPASVNVHVLRFSPPLEQAPDQIASRPFVTDIVVHTPEQLIALPPKKNCKLPASH